MADYNIPITRRHAEGHAAIEALLTVNKEWGYDETNDELCVRKSDGTYEYHSRHKLYGVGTNTAGVTVDASGNVTLPVIAAASGDTDKFIVSDGGVLKYRTGAQVASDIGALTSVSGGDHGTLSGLGDDDHTIYLLVDGSRAITGSLQRTFTDDGQVGIDLTAADYAVNIWEIDNASSNNGYYLKYNGGTDTLELWTHSGTPPGTQVWSVAEANGALTQITPTSFNDTVTFYHTVDFDDDVTGLSLDKVESPAANTSWNMSNKTLTATFTNPAGGIFFEWTGAASGHLFELQQNTGNPGAGTHLLHIESSDADVDHIHCELPVGGSGHALLIDQTGDTYNRMQIDADGKIEWGNGTDAVDTNLYRSSANTLKTDDSLEVTGDIYTTALTDYSGTSTVTGLTGTTTIRISYKKIGKTVIVYYYLYGDATGTSLSFTVPHAAGSQNVGEYSGMHWAQCFNNGGYSAGHASIGTSTSTIAIRPSYDATNWTDDSSTRSASGTFIYETA